MKRDDNPPITQIRLNSEYFHCLYIYIYILSSVWFNDVHLHHLMICMSNSSFTHRSPLSFQNFLQNNDKSIIFCRWKKKIHENRHNLWTNNNRRHFRKVKGSQQQQFGRIKRTPSCPLLTEIRIKNASLETPCAYLFNTLCLSNSSPCSCWLLACLTSFYLARATANKTIYIQLTCDKLEHIARQLPIVTTASLASVIFSRSLNTNCKCEEANPNRSNRAHTKKRDIRSTKTMTRKKLNRKKNGIHRIIVNTVAPYRPFIDLFHSLVLLVSVLLGNWWSYSKR